MLFRSEICWFDEACTASSQPQDATTSDRSPLKICEVEDEETMITPITTGFYCYFYFFNLLFWLWRLTEYLKYWGPVWWRRLTMTWQIQKVWAVNLRGFYRFSGTPTFDTCLYFEVPQVLASKMKFMENGTFIYIEFYVYSLLQ